MTESTDQLKEFIKEGQLTVKDFNMFNKDILAIDADMKKMKYEIERTAGQTFCPGPETLLSPVKTTDADKTVLSPSGTAVNSLQEPSVNVSTHLAAEKQFEKEINTSSMNKSISVGKVVVKSEPFMPAVSTCFLLTDIIMSLKISIFRHLQPPSQDKMQLPQLSNRNKPKQRKTCAVLFRRKRQSFP